MKLNSDIICIDIETTDTDSKKGEIVQIGAIRVSKEFIITDDFEIVLKPNTSYRNSDAMRVNGLSESELACGFEQNLGFELFENFCGKTKMLGAWGNYFDIAFLHEQYDKLQRPWPFHWKNIDLKSIAIWEFAKRDINFVGGVSKGLKLQGLEFEGQPHNAKDDIKNTVKILQKFLKEDYSRYGIQRGW